MKYTHLIIIGLLLVVIYLVWPSRSGFAYEDCGPCLEGEVCIRGRCVRRCGKGFPDCPNGERCYIDEQGHGQCFSR